MSNTWSIILLLFVGLFLPHGAQCRAPAPSPSPPALDCAAALLNLSACLTYVEAGSNLTRPGKGCCHALAGVVAAEPVCLCQLIGNSDDNLGVRVDTTKALMLPTACRVEAPPANLCAVLGTPIAGLSPSTGGPEEPGSSSSRELGPSVAAPPINDNDSGSSFKATGLAFLIILVFVW